MASRLSEDSVRAVYDAGHQALLVQSDPALSLLDGGDLDLTALLETENPDDAVQAVPALTLYHALKRQGVEDHLDVLPHMSDEQVQRTFDFEAWDADQLDPLKTCQWLQMFKEVSDEELARRFKGLEEEFQLALLSPFVEILDEDAYEKLGPDEQDKLGRLPCNTLYYRIKTTDNRIETMIDGLVEAMLALDLNYAYSMLAHATYVPPAEQEDMASRFRRARIEEEGFVSYEESLQAFAPLDLRETEARLKKAREPSAEGVVRMGADTGASPFLVAAIKRGALTWTSDEYAHVLSGFAFLANTLASAAQVETDDLAAMRRLLQQAQSLAGLGLEHLSDGDVAAAARIVHDEHPKTLFRAGLALIGELQDRVLSALDEAHVAAAPALRKLWELRRPGALLSRLDLEVLPILGFNRTETLKGLFNRFPVRPEAIAAGGSGEADRMLFGPIGSRAALDDFAADILGLCGVLHVAALVGPKTGSLVDLDRRLATAMAQALLGEPFAYAPLDDAATRTLIDLPEAAAQAQTSDLFAGIEGSLALALRNERQPAAAVQAAMNDLTDLALRMHQAREHDRRAGNSGTGLVSASGALDGIIDREDSV